MYEDGSRSAKWIKVKRIVSEDVFVIGATRSDAGLPFASLILERDGRYFGKVGTGFTDADRVEYLERLKASADGVQGIELPAEVRAEVLLRCAPIPAEIAFMEVSKAGLPRHPRWVKWRLE
jgi:DNA ligase-1